MKKKSVFAILPISVFFAACASPPKNSPAPIDAPSPAPVISPSAVVQKEDPYGLITCSTATESRTLAIAKKVDGGCELHYEKYGRDKVISWSTVSVDPCMRSRDKVRNELERAGWKCHQD